MITGLLNKPSKYTEYAVSFQWEPKQKKQLCNYYKILQYSSLAFNTSCTLWGINFSFSLDLGVYDHIEDSYNSWKAACFTNQT